MPFILCRNGVVLSVLWALLLCLCSAGASATPTSSENNLAGSSNWPLRNPARLGQIEGYASVTSVNQGGRIVLYVNTVAPSFNIDIFRMGYYSGSGARLMRSIANVPGVAQRTPCLNSLGVVECNWQPTALIDIPAASGDAGAPAPWPSGIYLAKLTTNGAGAYDSYIIFVVRDDARAADFIAQLPVTTYQAYNFWGGQSLYTGCLDHDYQWVCASGARRATRVSFNRPYAPSRNAAAAYGAGAGEFITNVQPVAQGYPITSAGFDYNLVRWIERQGYDIKYVSNIDLHQSRARLERSRAVVLMGHDEYYTGPMWDGLNELVQSGVNLAFFTSNEIYWQMRLEQASSGLSPVDKTMVIYKDGGDPVFDPALTTGRFRDLGRPEAALIGSQYVKDPVQGDVHLSNASHWLFNGTGATPSTVLPGLLGYEINARADSISPPNTVVLARSPAGDVHGEMTYYVAPSSAQVFATGTMQWAWGLDGYISNGTRLDYTSTVAQKLTANVFDASSDRGLASLVSAANGQTMSAVTSGPAPVVQAAPSVGLAKNDAWRILLSSETGKNIIVARASGLCLDAYGSAPGAPVGTWDCNGTAQQKWTLAGHGGDLFSMADSRTGMCLENSAGTAPGAAGLTLAACGSDLRQRWKRVDWRSDATVPPATVQPGSRITLTADGLPLLAGVSSIAAAPVVLTAAGANPGAVHFTAQASGDAAHVRLLAAASTLCLDAYQTSGNAVAGTWECHGGSNQDWLFSPLAEQVFRVTNRSSGLCLAYPGAATAGAALTLAGCAQTATQRWRVAAVTAAPDDIVRLQNKRSGLYAGLAHAGPSAAALVQGPTAFAWKFAPALEGDYVSVLATGSGLCVDAYSTVPGSATGTWGCHGGANQQWSQLAAAPGYVQLRERRSGLCLAVAAGSMLAGADLVLANCAPADQQLWLKTGQ